MTTNWILGLTCLSIFLDCGPAVAQVMRRIPPGIEIPSEIKSGLSRQLDALNGAIQSLESDISAGNSAIPRHWLDDIRVLAKAVRFAMELGEFQNESQIADAEMLLKEAQKRVKEVSTGSVSWMNPESGFAIRGYQSKIDDSYQPYGLELPDGFNPDLGVQYRLDVWLHGRDDSLSELKFLKQRLSGRQPFRPQNTITLHPYGRYCNGYKFAGEMDVLEAIEAVLRDYPIDREKIVLRGFSMGGAGVWHLATHHSELWAAASPGAGFAESANYLGLKSVENRPAYEKTLWHWYDATDYALNLYNLPIIAYSGEEDKQIQAAQIMEESMKLYGIELAHIIGPGMGHKYHPDSIKAIDDAIDSILAHQDSSVPRSLRFATWSLQYPDMHWFSATGLEKHWEMATCNASIDADHKGIQLETRNLSSFYLHFNSGEWKGRVDKAVQVVIDNQSLQGPHPKTDRSWSAFCVKAGNQWSISPSLPKSHSDSAGDLKKVPGLQGPIDDAFMDRFIIVTPSAEGFRATSDQFYRATMERLITEWKYQFRGEPIIKQDHEVTSEDARSSHLVLFGDPQSNIYIQRIVQKLPFRWNQSGIHTRLASFPADRYCPQFIYPNPENPGRYVVINSSFSFDQTTSSSNADQTPKLPDYVIRRFEQDGSTTISKAGFFNESWAFNE